MSKGQRNSVKEALRKRVLAHAKDEEHETAAEEKRESPAYQRMERKLGVEKHGKGGERHKR